MSSWILKIMFGDGMDRSLPPTQGRALHRPTTLSFLLCGILFCLLVAVPAPAADNLQPLEMTIPYGQLTRPRAQQLALDASPGVAQMLARIDAARAVVEQARSTMLPVVSAYASQRWQDVSMQPDWAPLMRYEDSLKSFSSGIQVNWLLFDGFSRRASILASEAGVKAAMELTNEARRLLAEAVASAYYQAQLAAEGMLIARQNRLFNAQLESDAEIRWQAGVIAEAEKLNFSVKALQAENDYLEAQQNFSIVCTVLAELLARPEAELSADLYPVASPPEQDPTALPATADEANYALQHRPDLQAMETKHIALLLQKQALKGGYFPKIFLSGAYEYDRLDDLAITDQQERSSYLGFNLTWDLYKGGERSAKIREIDAQLQQLDKEMEQKRLAIQSTLKQARIRAEAARAIYLRQSHTLKLVQRIRDQIEKAYRAGAATLTRLNEAQTDLVKVSGAVAASRISYLQQLESLRAASGRILEDIPLPPISMKEPGFAF
ncbi:MAG: hypothetical protein C0622_11375 [Desulfuromonas sp.]|nr:MAG: hypothetical protein C0622_11375 [Desulfuromonas sp.]